MRAAAGSGRDRQRAGHPGLIGQIRCDLFLGMLDGRFHHMTTTQVIAALITDYRPAGPATDPDPARPQPPDGPSGHPHGSGPTGRSGEPAQPDTTQPDTTQPDTTQPDSAQPGSAQPDTGTGRAAQRTAESGAGGAGTATGAPAQSQATSSTTGTGGAAVRDERVGIEIRVGLATLLGHDEHPGEIPGLGLLPAPDTRRRVALQRRAEWRFAITDTTGHLIAEGHTRARPDTIAGHHLHRDGPPGGIIELHLPAVLLDHLSTDPTAAPTDWAAVHTDISAQYTRRDQHLRDLDSRPTDRLPTAALRRHSEIRDRTCSFPGCRHRAHTCAQDHTHDHEHGGPTITTNLGPACAHDHDVKHRGGWRIEQPQPGTFRWHSPLGGKYHTRGEFLQPQMPDPEPVDLGPDFEGSTLAVQGPILRPRTPDPPRPPPPTPTTYPDEPPF